MHTLTADEIRVALDALDTSARTLRERLDEYPLHPTYATDRAELRARIANQTRLARKLENVSTT
jgi:hypothetical protein